MKNKIKKLIQSHQLITYFVLAIVLSTLMWLPLIFNRTTGDATTGPYWWLHYVGGIGPALAAGIVAWLTGGIYEIKKLFDKLKWSANLAQWILFGALLPILLLIVTVLSVGLFTGTWIELGNVAQSEKLPGVGLLGIFLFEIVFFGFGEEVGWRGFAWPRLREKFGFLMSSAILSLPWVLWHTATFFYNDNMFELGIGGTIGWVLSIFTGAIILGWLTDKARGNILPAILFHGIVDVVFVSKAVAGVYDSYLGAAIIVCSLVILSLSFTSKGHQYTRS